MASHSYACGSSKTVAVSFTVAVVVVVLCNTIHRSVQNWVPTRFDCETRGVEKKLAMTKLPLHRRMSRIESCPE